MKTHAIQTGSETRGEWQTIVLTVPGRGLVETQLEELKKRLLQPIVQSVANSVLVKEITWAANEAAALAWYTACPILVLPTLLEEKVLDALKKWHKQELLGRHQARRWWARTTPCKTAT